MVDRFRAAVINTTRDLHECAPTLVFEFPPQGQGLDRETRVVGLLVRETEDSSAAVRGAMAMTLLEALEEHDVVAAAGQPPRGCRTHRAGPHDRDVDALHDPTLRAFRGARPPTPHTRIP